MTKPRRTAGVYFAKALEDELRSLRLKVEQLQDKVREERRQRHLIEEELAFVRQQQVYQARRRLNGVAA
jgi:TolA-binding protein